MKPPKKSPHEVFIAKAVRTREIRDKIREEIGKCVARLVKRYPNREKVVRDALEGAYQALAAVAHRRQTAELGR